MNELTQELVQSLFNYKDGFLFWKVQKRPQMKIGDKAGKLENNGYYRTMINRKNYLNHRIIFLYHNGYLPKYVDHIDHNPLNNKIENLREITLSQNQMNCKKYKNTTSKYKGVSWYKLYQKWVSQIQINGKKKHLGYFNNEKAAAFIYNVYARGLFGEYANLNDLR